MEYEGIGPLDWDKVFVKDGMGSDEIGSDGMDVLGRDARRKMNTCALRLSPTEDLCAGDDIPFMDPVELVFLKNEPAAHDAWLRLAREGRIGELAGLDVANNARPQSAHDMLSCVLFIPATVDEG